MKKLMFFVSVIVLCFALTACGSTKESPEEQEDTNEVTVESAEEVQNVEDEVMKEEVAVEKTEAAATNNMGNNMKKTTENTKNTATVSSTTVHTAEKKDEPPKNESSKDSQSPPAVTEVTTSDKKAETNVEQNLGNEQKRSVEGRPGEMSAEKLNKIKGILDQKVNQGLMTAEERDKILVDIENGNMEKVKEILGTKR